MSAHRRNTPAHVRVRRFITAALNTRQPGMQPMEHFFAARDITTGERLLWVRQGPHTVPHALRVLNP